MYLNEGADIIDLIIALNIYNINIKLLVNKRKE